MTAGPSVAVVGGGLAGITAALSAADRGGRVVLLESRPRLGGLTASFTRTAAGLDLRVDTGQHVFLRCCTAYRDFLARLGAADDVVLQPRLEVPVRLPAVASTARIRRGALPAPLHLAATLLAYAPLRPRDRLGTVRAALALKGVDPASPTSDAESFGSWLRRHGQGDAAVDALWDLIGVATLNAHADDASLALAATVFQLGLLTDASAADLGWAGVPLGELHGERAEAALAEAGVEVRTRTRVADISHLDSGFAVDGEPFDAVVLAVPPDQAERLAPSDALDLPEGFAERLGSSPIVNVHVIYDRRVLEEELLAAVHSPVQWVFDRTVPSGLAGQRPGAQYLAVSLSAADDLVGLPAARVLDAVLPALEALLPAAAAATRLDAFVTREPHATFRAAPGSAAYRSGPRTRLQGLVVAGAWTATGWPATMEGAVRSGSAAVDALDLPAPHSADLPAADPPARITRQRGPRRKKVAA